MPGQATTVLVSRSRGGELKRDRAFQDLRGSLPSLRQQLQDVEKRLVVRGPR
jgi:hypothetical protein